MRHDVIWCSNARYHAPFLRTVVADGDGTAGTVCGGGVTRGKQWTWGVAVGLRGGGKHIGLLRSSVARWRWGCVGVQHRLQRSVGATRLWLAPRRGRWLDSLEVLQVAGGVQVHPHLECARIFEVRLNNVLLTVGFMLLWLHM